MSLKKWASSIELMVDMSKTDSYRQYARDVSDLVLYKPNVNGRIKGKEEKGRKGLNFSAEQKTKTIQKKQLCFCQSGGLPNAQTPVKTKQNKTVVFLPDWSPAQCPDPSKNVWSLYRSIFFISFIFS